MLYHKVMFLNSWTNMAYILSIFDCNVGKFLSASSVHFICEALKKNTNHKISIIERSEANWLIAVPIAVDRAYPSFCSMKLLGVFLLPLDGIIDHHRSLPCNLLGLANNLLVPIILLGGERHCESYVSCPNNTVSPTRGPFLEAPSNYRAH